ncbi:MAG: TIGR02996 domain-containing protein [Deltaproteobacteria bacterium]|nr:TIGR02996 domain-containing protein [Deltaproteobacteria bacterium]
MNELRSALEIRYPQERQLSTRAQELVVELVASLPAQGKGDVEKSAQQADALLAAIYDDAADDNVREVYADLLLERGDVRGELINLQLQAEGKTTPQRKRERALLSAHAFEWLGPLAAVFQKSGLRYERGFPVAGRVNGQKLSADPKLVGLACWTTFEELAVKGWVVPLRALVHPVLRGLRVLAGADLETAATLLEAKGPPRALRSLRTLLYCDEEDEQGLRWWETVLQGAAAPDLRELIVDSTLDHAEVDALLTSPLSQRLEHLRFDVQYGQVVEWVQRLSSRHKAPTRLTLHETFRHWNLTLSKGGDGRWSRLACSPEGRLDAETRRRLKEVLVHIPSGTISELSTPGV